MEAIVLSKATSKLPSRSVPFNEEWKHLMGLLLAYSDFEAPKIVDILLGADIFSRVVIQGPLLGPPGTSSKINTFLAGVLTATV